MSSESLPGRTRVWTSTQPGTGTPPEDADAGLDLRDVRSYRVFIYTEEGQTFINGGFLLAYLYDETEARWVPAPYLDLGVPAEAIDTDGYACADITMSVRAGRLAFVTSQADVTGGSVIVRVVGYTGPA